MDERIEKLSFPGKGLTCIYPDEKYPRKNTSITKAVSRNSHVNATIHDSSKRISILSGDLDLIAVSGVPLFEIPITPGII